MLLMERRTETEPVSRRARCPVGQVCAECFFGCALTDSARETIVSRRILKSWEKGEFLFHAGEPAEGIWAICRGRVKVFRETEDGKQLILRIAYPGDLVGHRSLLAGNPLSGYGVATEETLTAFLPARTVEYLIENEPTVRTQIMHKLACELGHAESLATNMAYSHAEERVLTALFELGRHDPNETLVAPSELSVPRQELAELAGLTVEATVRTLRRLEHAGILETHGRRISIVDPDRMLDAIAV